MAARDPASFYDDVWTRMGDLDARSPAARHRRRLLVARVKRALRGRSSRGDTGRVLDVGAGPGHLLRDLAAASPTLTLFGSDISPASLELARASGTPGTLFLLDLEASEMATTPAATLGPFDVVVCSEVLEHLADDHAAMRRLRALLAPGGTLIVTVPGGKMSAFDRRIGHLRHYSRRGLATLLAHHRLCPESVVAWGFPFHRAYRSAVRLASAFQFSGVDAERRPIEIDPILATLYRAAGSVLHPLFFLDRSWGGEQLIAVAHRERDELPGIDDRSIT